MPQGRPYGPSARWGGGNRFGLNVGCFRRRRWFPATSSFITTQVKDSSDPSRDRRGVVLSCPVRISKRPLSYGRGSVRARFGRPVIRCAIDH